MKDIGWDSLVDMVTSPRAGQPTIYASILGRGYRDFSFPTRPDSHWMPHSLLFTRYRVTLRREWRGWSVSLTVICNWCWV